MGKKLRKGQPWMPGFRYGALLPPLSLNLIVADVERSVNFYRDVFEAEIHYYALCEIKKQRQHPIEKTEHQC